MTTPNAMTQFSRRVRSAPILTPDEEYELAMAWKENGDEKALHKLTEAYLKFTVAAAAKFTRYNLPFDELIQEASIGLMIAAHKFEPEQGFRFSTYARHWIKAQIQQHTIQMKNLVQAGKTTGQRKVFFKMATVRAHIEHQANVQGIRLTQDELFDQVAEKLGVQRREVDLMAAHVSGNSSLNVTIGDDESGTTEAIDMLEDTSLNAETSLEEFQTRDNMRDAVLMALDNLKPREKKIILERALADQPKTLENLGEELQVSKERVRQVEAAALTKMKNFLEEKGLTFSNLFNGASA